MRTRAASIASAALLSILILALSGCLGGAPAPGPAADPCLVTSATDERCMQEARNATSPVQRPHLHDYWGGLTRVELAETSVEVGPFLCVDHATLALLRPADGETILQGASQVEATLSWSDPQPMNMPGATEIWVKSAADSVEQRVAPTTSGETHTLETDDLRNDLPHQLLSAWEFHLVMYGTPETGCFSYDGTVTLRLAITRGPKPIPLYPGHPDRWNGTEEVTLVDEARQVFYYEGGTNGMCLAGPNGGDCLWKPHEPANQTVVPYDAAFVEVRVTQDQQVPLLRMGFHGAKSRTLEWPDPAEVDGATRIYRIPVLDAGDGPYATQSQWQFWVVPEQTQPVYTGSYTFQAMAMKGT